MRTNTEYPHFAAFLFTAHVSQDLCTSGIFRVPLAMSAKAIREYDAKRILMLNWDNTKSDELGIKSMLVPPAVLDGTTSETWDRLIEDHPWVTVDRNNCYHLARSIASVVTLEVSFLRRLYVWTSRASSAV